MTPADCAGVTAPLTMNELRALGWYCVGLNQWRNDKYPGQTFTYREACEKEQENG